MSAYTDEYDDALRYAKALVWMRPRHDDETLWAVIDRLYKALPRTMCSASFASRWTIRSHEH